MSDIPVAPLVAAGAREAAKAAAGDIFKKVVIVIAVAGAVLGGGKLIIDAVNKPKSSTTAQPPGKPGSSSSSSSIATPKGRFDGVYSVSERDRTSCTAGTPFRRALAPASQSGPTYTYNVRVTTSGNRVSFGATSGGSVFTVTLASDGTFSGDTGSEYPATGRFKGAGGPGGQFELVWTARQGAGSCTTDLFGQYTSP